MNEVLELGGQDHVHEDHGETEGEQEVLGGFLKRLRAAGECHRVTGGEQTQGRAVVEYFMMKGLGNAGRPGGRA